jgi:Cell division protein FtsI/penicillin-binding protein 2
VVPLGQDDLDAFRKQLRQNRRFDSVPLKMRLTEDEIDRFAVNRWRFPGVDVVPYLTRRYPLGALFAHVVGYVSRIDRRSTSTGSIRSVTRAPAMSAVPASSDPTRMYCTAPRATNWWR